MTIILAARAPSTSLLPVHPLAQASPGSPTKPVNCVVVESGFTWGRLAVWVLGIPEEDLAIRHICRRMVCIV